MQNYNSKYYTFKTLKHGYLSLIRIHRKKHIPNYYLIRTIIYL